MMGSINNAIRKSALVENQLTSVERIFEYTKLAPEEEIAPTDEKKSVFQIFSGIRTKGYLSA